MPVPVPGQGGLPDSGARDCPAFLYSGSSLLLLSLYRETLPQTRGFRKPLWGSGWDGQSLTQKVVTICI